VVDERRIPAKGQETAQATEVRRDARGVRTPVRGDGRGTGDRKREGVCANVEVGRMYMGGIRKKVALMKK